MADAVLLIASARVKLGDPRAMLDKLCEHFAEHGTVTMTPRGGRLQGPFGMVDLTTDGAALLVRAEASDPTHLFVVKSSVSEHIVGFAQDEALDFVWSGDGAAQADIPYFHEMTVSGSRALTPRMRRITLSGPDIRRLETGGLHVRVLIPPGGRKPVWPTAAPDGRVIWPRGEDALTARVYTIRSIDKARGEVEIDVVLHEDSPGSVWAMTAQPGDPVGLMGPGGGLVAPADWYLLCGDETALPVIARIAEGLPATARATIRIEIADASERQPIKSAAAIDLDWLHREGAEPGTTELLEKAVRAVDWPKDGAPYVLAGCEHKSARAIRSYLRRERGLAKDRHLVAAYWRRGHSEPSADEQD
jgi:NADPH-dependent ferric siderophore reductase